MIALCLICIAIAQLSPAGASDRAADLYRAGKFEEAIAAAHAAPDSADALFYEGLSLARLNRFSEAERVFSNAALRFPNDKRFPLEKAGVLYREKRNASAEKSLERALRIDPDDGYGNDFLGTLYFLDGNLAAALKFWNRIDKPLLQDVAFVPPPAVDPVLLARAVPISGGQILTLDRLRRTEANLERLDFVASYRFDLALREDGRYDLTARLTPVSEPFSGWMGRILPYLSELPYQTVDIGEYNIGGRGMNFMSLTRWDENKRRVFAEFQSPWHSDPRRIVRFAVDARDEHWNLSRTYRGAAPLYDLLLRRIEFGADLVAALGAKLDWTTSLRLVHRWYRNSDGSRTFAPGISLEESNRLGYRLLDIPEHRLRMDAAATLHTGGFFSGPGSSFATAGADVRARWLPDARGNRWEVLGRLIGADSAGSLPFDELFEMGMDRDNDVWYRGIDAARDGRKGNAPLGTRYALAQTDLYRTVFTMPFVEMKAGPFFDLASVSGAAGFGSSGARPAAGIEVRIIARSKLMLSLVYGRDIRTGRGAFYTAVTR